MNCSLPRAPRQVLRNHRASVVLALRPLGAPLRRLRLVGLIFSALFLCGFGPPRLVDSEVAPTYSLSTAELRQWQAAQQFDDIAANAALVYDVAADRVLAERNADQAVAVASLTKLMTALLVLEKNELQASVTILTEDQIGEATMGLQAGEVVSVEQLLWGLLVPSGNDAAMALARTSAGSVAAFVDQMNRRAAELGMTQTHFVNPNGFDADGHLSSARDLLIITRRLWQYPLFQQIVGTAETTVAGHAMRNTNEILGVEPGINGVKTGTTDAAGQCLVAGIVAGDRQRFVIVLGSVDRYADTRRLITRSAQSFPWLAPAPQRSALFNRLYLPDGSLHFLRVDGTPPNLLLPSFERNRLRSARLFQPYDAAKWIAGATVGELQWKLGDRLIGAQPLILQ